MPYRCGACNSHDGDGPDHYVYRDVTFYPDTIRFFVAALKYYAGRMTADVDALEDEPDLREVLLQQSRSGESKVEREPGLITHFLQKFERCLSEQPNALDYEIDISKGYTRLLKSVCELYLEHLRERRNLLAFSENQQPHRYNTVIQEATRILEERLRTLSRAGNDQFGAVQPHLHSSLQRRS